MKNDFDNPDLFWAFPFICVLTLVYTWILMQGYLYLHQGDEKYYEKSDVCMLDKLHDSYNPNFLDHTE